MGDGLDTHDLENTLPVNVGFAMDPESLQESELGLLRGGGHVTQCSCPCGEERKFLI